MSPAELDAIETILESFDEWTYEDRGLDYNYCSSCGANTKDDKPLVHRPGCKRRAAMDLLEKIVEVGEVLTLPYSAIIVCVRCGSLIDYRRGEFDNYIFSPGQMHTCQWCPACAPDQPWRRGKVVDETPKAKKLRDNLQPGDW